MTAQSLLVVLKDRQASHKAEFEHQTIHNPWSDFAWALLKEINTLETSIRVIEDVLRSTRETRKEFGDNTLEAEADLGLGSSTPS